MAEQFLQRAQVRTPGQQMSRETVAQRVRGQRIGQAEPVPGIAHRAADEVGIERPAAHPDEQRAWADQRPRAFQRISADRFAHRLDHRDHPGLAAFAGRPQRPPDRQRVGGKRHCLGDPQPRAIQQQQDGEIALADPIVARRPRLLGQRQRVGRACRTGQGARPLGGTRARQLRDIAGVFRSKGQEGAHRGHLARRAARPQALTIRPAAAPLGQEGAQVLSGDIEQAESPDLLAAILPEKVDEAMRGGDIGADRMRRPPTIMGKVRIPSRRKAARGMIAQSAA